MPYTMDTEIIDHLDGLKDAFTSATAGFRLPVTVVNRETSNIYTGTFPLIQLDPRQFQDHLITGNSAGPIGQDLSQPCLYQFRIQHKVQTAAADVSSIQTDVYKLAGLIRLWFRTKANRCLPDGSAVARCQYAGFPLVMNFPPDGPYTKDGAEYVFAALGTITVVGFNWTTL